MEDGERPKNSTEGKLETGGKIFDFLDKTKFLELRKDENRFDDWIKEVSYEDFSKYLVRLNGILRGIPIKNRHIDGENVEILSPTPGESLTRYLPPESEKKDELMEKTFNSIKNIPDNNDRALLMYYVIQAIHPFADGNGRTGRLIYEIISDGGKNITRENISKLLDHNESGDNGLGEGRDIFSNKILEPNKAYYYINREVAKQIFNEDLLEECGRLVASGLFVGSGYLPENIKDELSEQEIKLAKKIIGEADVQNFSFRSLILVKLLIEKGVLQNYQEQEEVFLGEEHGVISEDIGKKMLIFDAEKFIDEFTKDDVKRLIEIHRTIKTKFMENMIDIFVNPEEHQIKNEQGESIPIKNMFRL